jgi:hypothetical protein
MHTVLARGVTRHGRAPTFFTAGCLLLSADCGNAVAPSVARTDPWQYEVAASPGAKDLSVVATFPPRTDPRMSLFEPASSFVGTVEVAQMDPEHPWREVNRTGPLWAVPECALGCRIRYHYRLAEGARSWGDVSVGDTADGVTLAPPSTWLLRPEHVAAGALFRFHVSAAPGEAFVSGVFRASDTPPSAEIYEARASDLSQLPYSAFGPLRVHAIANGAATLALLPGKIDEEAIVAWATEAVTTVEAYYGRPPVPHVLVLVRPTEGDEVGSGTTMGYSGAAIVVKVGAAITREGLRKDWVLVHELVHTALPDLPDDHHWLEEGLATYVEPLARYRAGSRTDVDVWTEWRQRMAQGEPQAGDLGLNRTHTWGRTYWGGALFCLAADVELRSRTQGKSSLESVLREILARGGNISSEWSIENVLAAARAATGTDIVHEMYEKLAKKPTPVDLPMLWRRLGVVGHGDAPVTFDDGAELAWVRRGMTPAR